MHPSNPIFAIIIPIYNAESYISEALQSLLNQSYDNWVAICVNDGSTDNSLKILRNFQNADSRINVFSKSNEGVSKARNFALNKLSNFNYDWITFFDIDDILMSNHLQTLANIIKNVDESTQYIRSHSCTVFDRSHMISISNKLEEDDDDKYKLLTQEEYFNNNDVGGLIASCTISKQLFEKYNIFFPSDMRLMEDQVFSIKYALKSESIAISNKKNYVIYGNLNPDKYPNSAHDIILCINKIWDDIKYVKSPIILDYFSKIYFPNKILQLLIAIYRGSAPLGAKLSPEITIHKYCVSWKSKLLYPYLKLLGKI